MKIGQIDLFKIFMIILLGMFLYLYYQNSSIGRFQTHREGFILDTKTGEIFRIESGDGDVNYYKPYTQPILK